jgi:peptide deformylase
LDGKLYVNRLVDRYARKAMKQAKKNGWGVPGLTWMPGVDPDPFGH